MDAITQIAGQTITVGTIATFTAQFLKGRAWFPEAYRTAVVRLLVAAICVVVNVGVAYVSGEPIGASPLLEAFLSYLTAAAAYDHLFKN